MIDDCSYGDSRVKLKGIHQYILKVKGVHKSIHTIQIKICAEYWDMLTRSRLVCQEPGLRPADRPKPRCPDKSSQGLGIMSLYSAQILICLITYIFHFFYSSVGLVGNFAGLPVYTAQCPLSRASYQIRKIAGCPCAGNTGNVSPAADLKGNRELAIAAYITARA